MSKGVNQLPVVAEISAEQLPKGGIASGVTERIAQIVTASSASTIAFSGIPSGYSNLRILLCGRCSSGDVVANWMYFNADTTAANYEDNQAIQATDTVPTAFVETTSTSGITAGIFPGTDTSATAVGVVEIIVPLYAGSAFHKVFLSQSYAYAGGTVNRPVRVQGGRWKSTEAITAITLTAGSGNYVDGTTATIYGLP